MLEIHVYDWDKLTKNDSLGFGKKKKCVVKMFCALWFHTFILHSHYVTFCDLKR
jgi:hypothetical protein